MVETRRGVSPQSYWNSLLSRRKLLSSGQVDGNQL